MPLPGWCTRPWWCLISRDDTWDFFGSMAGYCSCPAMFSNGIVCCACSGCILFETWFSVTLQGRLLYCTVSESPVWVSSLHTPADRRSLYTYKHQHIDLNTLKIWQTQTHTDTQNPRENAWTLKAHANYPIRFTELVTYTVGQKSI